MTLSTIMPRPLVVLAACAVALSVQAQSPGQAVKPKQRFPSPLLDVHAPDSEGWVFAGAASNGISFAKRGAQAGETYAAQVILFPLRPTGNSEEFIASLKERIAEVNPAPRFQELVSEYRYGESRGYPCADVRVSYDDHEAVTPTGKERLRLKVVALYCRHPVKQEIGFFAAYSYRGRTAEADIEGPARNFIEAIQVSK
jgi:hypothetical protein